MKAHRYFLQNDTSGCEWKNIANHTGIAAMPAPWRSADDPKADWDFRALSSTEHHSLENVLTLTTPPVAHAFRSRRTRY
jgi:hypothetical protein